jgi:thiamine transport system substrate-binding protein
MTLTKIMTAVILLCLGLVNAHAADKPDLTIYTYDAFAAEWGPAPKLKEVFEKTCECTVSFVTADSSIGALRKVQLEGAETKADIILGLDTNIAEAARATGLFAEHDADQTKLDVPVTWTDATFLPFDYSYFAFVYDSENVKTPPASFAELAALPDDFKIIVQDPRSSTPGLGLVLWMRDAYGDKAPEMWKKLAPKILTVTKGWSDAYGLFLKGEADMVLSYTTSPAYHLIAENDAKYKAAAFSEGHYLQVEVAGILKSSKHPELAKKFMQFMLSDAFQDIIPTTNWTYPATKTATGLPEGFKTLHVPSKSLLIDGKKVEENRKAWIDEWLQAIGR